MNGERQLESDDYELLKANARAAMIAAADALTAFTDALQKREITEAVRTGDRLLSTRELLKRLGCSESTLRKRFRAGYYSFLLRDGRHIVGSERGLERWIAARTGK